MNPDQEVCVKFPTHYTLINLTLWKYDKTKNREDCNFIAAVRQNTGWKLKDYIIAIPDKNEAYIKRFNAPTDYVYEPRILTTLESSIIVSLDGNVIKPQILHDLVSIDSPLPDSPVDSPESPEPE